MKYIQAFIYSIRAYKAMKKMKAAKKEMKREQMGLPPEEPWYSTLCETVFKFMRENVCELFCPCCLYDRFRFEKKPRTLCQKMIRDGTPENEFCKSLMGFFGGVVFCFAVFVAIFYKTDTTGKTAILVSLILGMLLTIAMALAESFRCIVLLMVPSVFSSNGRNLLIIYAFLLVVSGPALNFTHNMQEMSQTMSCGQMKAYNNTADLVELALAPVKAISKDLYQVIVSLNKLAFELRKAFLRVKKVYVEIVDAVARVSKWLGNLVDVCNEKMGAPYRKCKNAFDEAQADCMAKLGFLDFLCDIVSWFKGICEITRLGDFICIITEAIVNRVKISIGEELARKIDELIQTFNFRVEYDHGYNLTVNMSKSYAQVTKDIFTEIKERARFLDKAISLGQITVIFMLIWLFVKSTLYRKRYLSKDGFDNVYISYRFRDIDEVREETGKETVLPLEWREQFKYISPFSLKLVEAERSKLVKGLILWIGSLIHAGFYLWMDYGLYWLLAMLRREADLKTRPKVPSHLKMHVNGDSVMADMYRELITTFDPMRRAPKSVANYRECLPNPSIPDYATYEQIAIIFGITLFLLFTEAYGLRLRHQICACYYPYRERVRAVWLYNQILHRRGGFLKYARRMIRQQFIQEPEEEERSFQSRLAATSPLFRKILKWMGYDRKFCLSCGKPGEKEDWENFIQCYNKECGAIYCMDCFTDIQNICSACMNPVDYGDASDFSEERDSSDEEMRVKVQNELDEMERESDSSYESLDYGYQYVDEPPTSDSEYDYEVNIRRRASQSVNLVPRRPTVYETSAAPVRMWSSSSSSSDSSEGESFDAEEPIKAAIQRV